MRTIKEYEEAFTKVIRDNKLNTRLINSINKEFVRKGLGSNASLLLFEEGLGIEELTKSERICLSKAMYDYLDIPILNPKLYFTDTELSEYDLMVTIPKIKEDRIIFHEVKQLNSKSYIGVLKAKDSVLLRDNRLFAYFKEVQRPTINSKTKSGVVRRINVNKKGVEDLKGRFKAHNILPTTITFSVLIFESKEVNVEFNKTGETIGDLIIRPNFNREDRDYTPFIINDGYHRLSALMESYDEYMEEYGEELEEGLYCEINLTSLEEAKQYFIDSFKHNILKEEELKPLIPSNKSKFVDCIINNCELLKNKVGTSYNDMKTSGKLTYKSLLIDTVEALHVEPKNDLQRVIEGESIGKTLNLLLSLIWDCGGIYEVLHSTNIFVGYLTIIIELKKDNDYIKKLDKVKNVLCSLDKEDFIDRGINLNSKNCNIDKIISYFRELLINNEI